MLVVLLVFLKHMVDIGFEPYGVDISEYAINKCRNSFDNKNFCCLDINFLLWSHFLFSV